MSEPVAFIAKWLQPKELVEHDPESKRRHGELMAVAARLAEMAEEVEALAWDVLQVNATRRPNPDYDPAVAGIFDARNTPLLRHLKTFDYSGPPTRVEWGTAELPKERE